MKATTVFFDLDGTLTDSGEGIIRCAIETLRHFSLPVPDWDTLRVFVGPPLRDSFHRFGVPPERMEEAIEVYRKRYTTVGKWENFPYPGIEDALKQLKEAGYRLYVATSKPEGLSIEILEKFRLAPYFEKICGASLDGSRDSKEAVIGCLLQEIGERQGIVMVGDTAYDVVGAAAHGIPTIGVSWGYGSRKDMLAAGAVAMADRPEELPGLLQQPWPSIPVSPGEVPAGR